MANFRPLSTGFWNDPACAELDPPAGYVFIYLFTNPETTESGVYPCTPRIVSRHTNVSIEDAERYLTSDLKEKVVYDPESQLVWVKNFMKHNASGNPEVVFRSVLKSWRNHRESSIWPLYFAYNEHILIDLLKKPKLSQAILEGRFTVPDEVLNYCPTLAQLLGNPSPTLPQGLPNSTPRVSQGLEIISGGKNFPKPPDSQVTENKDDPMVSQGFPNPSPTLTQPSGKGTQKSSSIYSNITNSSNASINPNGKQGLSFEKKFSKEALEVVGELISEYQELFNRPGYEVDFGNNSAQYMFYQAAEEFGSEKVIEGMQWAAENWIDDKKMRYICHWNKLLRHKNMELCIQNAAMAPPATDSDPLPAELRG